MAPKRCYKICPKQSDEVEAGVLLFEAGMYHWWVVSATSSLSDKRSESVSVSDDGRFFDGSAHVVVGEAQLVGERFEQVRRGSDGVVDNGVPSWGGHALSSSHRNQVELVGVFISDSRVYNGSWQWVLEPANISSEESGVDSLAGVDIEELGRAAKAKPGERLLDLVDLSAADTLDLSFTNTVSVEDDLCWIGTIGSLEGLTGSVHSIAERVSSFLAYVILDDTCRPIGRRTVVHGATQSEH